MHVLDRRRGVRLRTAVLDEYERHALPWYRDPEVLRFSEGGAEPYGIEQIRAMFDTLTRRGELYLIERAAQPIGDAALLPDDVPIVIGRPEDRSLRIGTEVLALLIVRARERELRVGHIHPANMRSVIAKICAERCRRRHSEIRIHRVRSSTAGPVGRCRCPLVSCGSKRHSHRRGCCARAGKCTARSRRARCPEHCARPLDLLGFLV